MAFYIAAGVATAATLRAVTCRHAVHGLLWFVVSLLAVAVVFLLLGAAFVAALEVIVYAGAIVVLILFVIMLLNPSEAEAARARHLLRPRVWIAPALLCLVLAGELIYVLAVGGPADAAVTGKAVGPQRVGVTLLGPYLLGVELASMLLLAGLVAAFHLGRPNSSSETESHR